MITKRILLSSLFALACLLPAAAAFGQTPGDIVGISIACSNDKVYVWYSNRTLSIGTSENLGVHQSFLPPHPYALPPGKRPADIIGIGIAKNDHVYAWYSDGTVSSGTSTQLDQYRAPYRYSLAPGKSPADVVGIDIACSDDHVYVWYRDGSASSGTTDDLDKYRSLYSYSLAPGQTPATVAEIGIAGNDRVYVWYKTFRVSSGTSEDLDKNRSLYSYSFSGPLPANPSRTAFDLSVNTITANNPSFDDNAILLNPIWASQKSGQLPNPSSNDCGGKPYANCTTQTTTHDNGTFCGGVSTLWVQADYDGHFNWAAGTYAGLITWSHLATFDRDYNFKLAPPDQAGLTTANRTLKLEFDSHETINYFGTPWWDSFHKAVDQSEAAARQMVDGRFAIATGLVGLDCSHECRSELHPVWAMAIRVEDDPSDEVWAIFVRRWGNEGFCSDDQHYLEGLQGNTYTFRLPWRPGASSVAVSQTTVFRSRLGVASGPDVLWAPNQGVLVSFTMPVLSQVPTSQFPLGERVHGELHLQWTGSGTIGTLGTLARRPSLTATTRAQAEQEDEPESRFAQLVTRMNPVQRRLFDSRMAQKRTISSDAAPLRLAGAPRRVASLPLRTARAQRPTVRAVTDAEKKAEDQERLDALRAVYGNNIPGFKRP